ncbi:ABC transporter ATP-binding protein [Vulgatibacter incomptus]|uniref:Methionine ABC transporter ATP-binding protein n=1 Tax=Vulgatibacter incomptus TaxID=1391653 RepID=A0A0K1PBL3_9BACT|nr:ABC transporter ATP-binding protein [Vulgatibacter incomptus]AKU90514.1 Methionine ABC transporter ATP-binding protein [Vulgatibacter incomptus]
MSQPSLQPLSHGGLRTGAAEELIAFRGLYKAFGPKRIYEGLDLDVRRGETITVIGGSGTGKSVLLKCLIGLLSPDEGSIVFDGEELVGRDEDGFLPVRRQIAMLFQGAALFDSLDVGENVAYPIREHFPRIGAGELADRVAHKLELVGLPGVEKMRPSDLSGGMKKRVGLARAIAIDPAVVLYDEPTTGLDPINTRRINELIIELNEKLDVTSIVVTHDMQSAYMVSHRMAMLFDRRIIAKGTPEELRGSALPEVQTFIGAMDGKER